MQSAPADAPARRWRQILGLGVVLGLLQLLLFTQTEALEQRFTSTSPELAMIALLYLFIPALAGFLVTRQSEAASSGTGAGCLVGGIGFLVIAIPLYLFMILALPPTSGGFFCFHCPPQPHPYDPFTSLSISTTLIVEGVAGAGFGLLGGWLGGLLGPRQTAISRGRTLLLGVALTLPLMLSWMLLLFRLITSLLPFSLVALPVSALFYLLIPGVEGFLTAQQNEEGCSGVDRGCLVGVFSILTFAIATVALLVVAPSVYPGPNGSGNGVLVGLLLATFVLHALGCVFGGLLGGWLGGLLGRRQRATASQHSKTAEHPATEAD